MKAIVIEKQSDVKDVKFVTDAKIPEPSDHEIRIKLHAAGLNPVDHKRCRFDSAFFKFPHILGVDGAGEVEKIGSKVTEFKKGDKVYIHNALNAAAGTFAEYTVIDASVASHIPTGLSYVEAAALPCAAFTAYQGLTRRLHAKKGEWVLVTGAGGGVGGFVVQFGVHMGLEIIATCSTSKIEWVKKLGAKHVIDYTKQDTLEEVKKITNGEGVDCIYDNVSGPNAAAVYPALRFGGRLLSIVGGVTLDQTSLFLKGQTLTYCFLPGAHTSHLEEKKDLRRIGDEVATLFVQHKMNPMVSSVIPFEDIPKALIELSGGHVQGKIVAQIVK